MRKKFNLLNILVLGDVMLDEYIATKVHRISPEAPVPVAQEIDRWKVAGGAANVARNLAHLGCKVSLVGMRGNDEAGKNLSTFIIESNIEDALHISGSNSTIQKTRIISQGQQMIRLDHEENFLLSNDEYTHIYNTIFTKINTLDAVILSDYAKGILYSLPDEKCLAQDVIKLCNSKNIPVFVDPKGTDWTRYSGATCVTPNTAECSVAVGYDCNNEDHLELAAQTLLKDYALQNVLVTRSEKGMALFNGRDESLYIKTKIKEVIDVSGAGDTVIAVLAACYVAGYSLSESAEFANRAAGRVVIKSGTTPITQTEFTKILEASAHNAKLVTLNELIDLTAQWKKENKKIVFTNGCFDILHKGHVQLLQDCADYGDKLVVALNTDNSVKKLKGPTRPIQDEVSRAFVLAGLQCVDAVILFDDETPLELITAITPDILVKGGDYTVETIVGADVILNSGGDVKVVKLVENMSTSSIVARILQNHA